MKIMIRMLYIIIMLSLLNCSPYSNRQYHYNYQSYNANCEQLYNRLQQLEYRKQDIHKNDKFKFKYMLIFPSFIEILRMSKEKKNIKKEKFLIEGLLVDKHCNRPASKQQKAPLTAASYPAKKAPPSASYGYYSADRKRYQDYYQKYYGK